MAATWQQHVTNALVIKQESDLNGCISGNFKTKQESSNADKRSNVAHFFNILTSLSVIDKFPQCMLEKDVQANNIFRAQAEALRDKSWISRHISQLWPFASIGYAEFGKGVVQVILSSREEGPENGTAEMNYISIDSIQIDEEAKQFMSEYDPDIQFLLMLEKNGDITTTGEQLTSFYKPVVYREKSGELKLE